MKKNLLFLLPLLLFSCSSEETPSHKIVGTWAFYGVIDVTATGEEFETLAGECAAKSQITFKNNSEFVETDYHYSYNTMECIWNETTSNRKMMWEEVAEGQYRIFSDGSKGTTFEMRFPNKNTLWMIPPHQPYEKDGVTIQYTAYVHKRL